MPIEDDQPDDGKSLVIRSADFAARLRQVLKDFPRAPKGRGANAWLERELRAHGAEASRETVRKWLLGVNRPHQDTLEVLAQVLQTDLAWLSTGATSAKPSESRGVRDQKGAANFVGGIFQMNGVPLSPAANPSADFSVIIAGEQHDVLCRFGRLMDDGARVVIPSVFYHLTTLVVIPGETDVDFGIYRLTREMIRDRGTVRGDSVVLDLRLTKSGYVAGEIPVARIQWLDNLEGEKAGSPT